MSDNATPATVQLWRAYLDRQNEEIFMALLNQNKEAAQSTLPTERK